MQTLKPCPFCGGKASIERKGDRRMSTIYSCDWCGCSLETGEEWDHGKAWNIRPAPADTDTGLVRYDLSMFGNGIVEMGGGAYVRADQAEELLAAKEARIKELDRCHEGTIDLCNQKTAQIEALEAKLAAAEKALEEVHTYVQSQRTQLDVTDPEYWAKYQTLKDTGTKIREARAVLGGKLS